MSARTSKRASSSQKPGRDISSSPASLRPSTSRSTATCTRRKLVEEEVRDGGRRPRRERERAEIEVAGGLALGGDRFGRIVRVRVDEPDFDLPPRRRDEQELIALGHLRVHDRPRERRQENAPRRRA